MNLKNFLVILVAIVAAVGYAYFASEDKPDKAMTLSPTEYMQQVEKDKRDRRSGDRPN